MSAPRSIPPELVERHRQFNRNSEARWQGFAGHRAQVTALLGEAAQAHPGARALVLGAGNCNDLDLATLAPLFAELHLVDLDADALARGVERQGAAANLHTHAPVDVTGYLPQLKAFAKKPLGFEATLAAASAAADAVLATLGGPFDVVVSTGLLSQLMHTCRLALSPDHPALGDLAEALVIAHLRALLGAARAGGRVLLITDVASTRTYPLVELWNDQPPGKLLETLEASENVLSGTGPAYLRRKLVGDPVCKAALARTARVSTPWLWELGDDVTLMAYALVMERK